MNNQISENAKTLKAGSVILLIAIGLIALAVSIGLPLGSYFLFDKWFMIPMPKGLWGEHLGL